MALVPKLGDNFVPFSGGHYCARFVISMS
jgi:hypothetical protein